MIGRALAPASTLPAWPLAGRSEPPGGHAGAEETPPHGHAFTLAVDRLCRGGGEAFVRVDGHGEVSHSVYRLSNTRTSIDETGAVHLDSVPGMLWRRADMTEIVSMATRRGRVRRARGVLANVAARFAPG